MFRESLDRGRRVTAEGRVVRVHLGRVDVCRTTICDGSVEPNTTEAMDLPGRWHVERI